MTGPQPTTLIRRDDQRPPFLRPGRTLTSVMPDLDVIGPDQQPPISDNSPGRSDLGRAGVSPFDRLVEGPRQNGQPESLFKSAGITAPGGAPGDLGQPLCVNLADDIDEARLVPDPVVIGVSRGPDLHQAGPGMPPPGTERVDHSVDVEQPDRYHESGFPESSASIPAT